MQRIRIRYTKEDRVRFVSARDLTAVWERALRRTGLPIAYSEGFTPHAKVSFPDALPVGYASTGEYAELTFAAPIDPARGMASLSAALPDGMDILTYAEVPDGAPKLARLLPVTLWELVYDAAAGAVVSQLRRLGEELLAADVAEVIRHRPDGDRTIDVRPALLTLHAHPRTEPAAATTAVLRAVLRNDGPNVRPSDLHSALTARIAQDPHAGPGGDLPEPRLYRRVVQGSPQADGVADALSLEVEALAPDRLAGAA